MADLLEQAAVWLEVRRKRYLTQTVVYRRRDDAVAVAATIGETIFRLDDGAGAVLRVEVRDYLITAADLVIAGVPIVPKRGDHIVETVGNTALTYEVTAPGDEPEWRWSDLYRQTYRIHTQQVEMS